ncbi:bifunctional metallophosphatase/5'-nucleotidase [Fredinandcohnia sp. SECRCQ15]|uniref:Bifunctional metallophosphatase/5'-nucleotidase n=1 Tax=Fredinandcohnia quinoae TaxID=2918902 RepID=A0AAW5E6M6_9BACI|nr:bifunctional UDP-sugar hydrolase/5'-nucleotidase [Fredinandcohnia sp. SECRCQ15]MCH1625552.1 bifunctional metallophosphatase/5'-nucleotidase [Fredinandcohnia sp. SECRCQ15]
MIETLHIYHTNDLHSHFDQWPKITKYITDMRQLHSNQKEEMLLIDIGDHMDRFHPISEADYGKTNIQLLNRLDYDYVTIGNNEGITLSYDQLDSLYDEANFKVVLGNFFDRNGNQPSWAIPFDIHTLPSGVKIGIIGLTVHYISLYKLLGWNVTDPFKELKKLVDQLSDKTDILMLLSHLGINEDEKIAQQFPEVDIILGGHTHHLLDNGKLIKNTLLCGAGKYGNYIGHVKLQIDTEKRKIHSRKANVIQTNELAESNRTKDELDILYKNSINALNRDIIAELDDDLLIDWHKESSFSTLLARALKEWCGGEISMVNAGVLLDSLPKGIVTRGDLHRVCPHPINPCKVMVRGDHLKEIIIQAYTEQMENLEIKGLGFRGKLMGKMIYDGVQIKSTILSDGLKHVADIKINHEDIDPGRLYSVATIDMFTFGMLFPEIRDAKDKKYYMPELLRDVLAIALKKGSL